MERVNDRVRKILRKAGAREMLGAPENIDGHEVTITYNGIDYAVIIDESVYEMNQHANMPNGVNIYLGELYEIRPEALEGDQIKFAQSPQGLQVGIRMRMEGLEIKEAR